MRNFILSTAHAVRKAIAFAFFLFLFLHLFSVTHAQTPAFPGATGFGRFAKGARAVANPTVYVVTNLYDSGPGSFREAVSVPGRVVVFAVGGIINLSSDVVVAANCTIAGQTAPGDGIVFFGKRITFTSAANTICRYLRIRLGATGNSGKDASGLANGNNMIFDHMSFSWGMDEVFSINWDSKGTAPDSITVQNSIIAQGLHRENHSAGGLIQTPDGGKVSLIRNLYISNKTRNPKVKGINEFVNNVVYDWGNGNRLGDNMNYGWSGDAYIMGGSAGVSEVNIINNYFMSGPLTPPGKTTPFSRGTGTFYLYGSGNFFDKNQNGITDGELVPYDTLGYPGIGADGFKTQPFPYPQSNPAFTAEQAYAWVIDSVGASYPRRDQVDSLLAEEVRSRGTQGYYVYRESDLPFANGGVGTVFNAPAPLDTDADGMPDSWEDANGLNKNNAQDAIAYSTAYLQYLNIEVYINSLPATAPAAFIKPPTNVTLTALSFEQPDPYSTIKVQWADNANNEDYFVLERSQDGVTYTDITHPAINATSYTDSTGLQPNTTWYYRIKAVNATGFSSYSAPVSVKTPPLPSAPAAASSPVPANGFEYAELSSGTLVLKWTGSSNTEKYAVYIGTDTSNLVKKAEIPYAASASYTVPGLIDFTKYYWRIDAINSKGTTVGDLWWFRTTKSFPAGMVGRWSFDETEGRQVTDSSVYQNHGILGLDDDNQSIRVPGKVGGALDFATANPAMYVVNIPHQDQLYLNKSSFSLSFWMKADASLLPPNNNTSAYLLCKGSITRNAATGATGKRFDIEFKNKQIRFAIDDDNDAGGGGKDELQADGTPFFTSNWVHVITIRDTAAKKLKLYMNGALVKETAITKANAGIGEASDLIIGNIGALEFLSTTNKPAPYKGMLDELKIFNYALSPAQIAILLDTVPPVVITKNISVTLSNGTASVSAADINNGSLDANGIKELIIDKSTFSCLNIGPNEVQLTVVDSNNNAASAKAIVTVTGSIPAPAIAVSRTNTTYTGADANTIFLGYGAQQVTLTATNASPSQYSWAPATGLSNATIANPVFTSTKAGAYTFTVTATNEYGCTAIASVTIPVIDVRCGYNNQKVIVCHRGHEICIDKWQAANHLQHGCYLGNCECRYARVAVKADPVSAPASTKPVLMVYPTPTSHNCTISFTLSQPGKYSVEIYNVRGQMVLSAGKGEATTKQLHSLTINTSELTSGVYYVKLITASEVRVTQMIIQR